MIVSGNLSKTFGFYFSVISLLAIAACSDSGPSSDSGQAELNQAPPEPDAYYEYLWCKLGDNWTEQTMGCLLYTSPSPRDRQKSRMPSSA